MVERKIKLNLYNEVHRREYIQVISISFNYSEIWSPMNVISNKIMLIPDILELDSSAHPACTMKHPVPETKLENNQEKFKYLN